MAMLATDRAADEREKVVYEGVDRVGRDEVTLRLRRGCGEIFTLERQLVRAGGVTLTQVFPVGAESALHDFASADPYGDSLQGSYLALRHRYLSEGGGRRTAIQRSDIPGDFVDQIGEIEHCHHEAELLPIAQAVTQALGAEQYIFSWLVLDEKSGDVIEHRYLVGCDPAWLNKYIDRVWYMNDPLLEYAKRNVTPVLSSRLDLYSDAHWLATEATTHGFRNNLICPVHAGTNSFIVMLQASNAEPREVGEGALWRNRRLLRALACELLDWRLVGLRQYATSQFDLSEQDLEVLRMVHDGGTASHVAEVLNVSVKAVYKVAYPRINHKMGTPHINKAAALAVSCGLIK
jgi:DNA-binding CsgD family transcriptional regulator